MSTDDTETEIEPAGATAATDTPTATVEPASKETELRLRRDLAKVREHARAVQAERENAISQIRAESDQRVIRSELRVAAVRSGIIDIDALRLIDTAGLTVAGDGSVEGAETAVANLREAKAYLFEDGRKGHVAAFTSSMPRPTPAPAQPDPVDARTLTREKWQVEKARVLARLRQS